MLGVLRRALGVDGDDLSRLDGLGEAAKVGDGRVAGRVMFDGVVHLDDEGVTVLLGTENDGMRYPFRIAELKGLARVMEAAEDELQSRQ